MNTKWRMITNMMKVQWLGGVIGVMTGVLLYITPITNSSLKLIISIFIGLCIGFLFSLVLYLNERANKYSIHDELTGVYNKNFLSECKYRVMSHTDRHQTKMGIITIDINRLNDVIHLHGRKAGKAVLRYVGEGIVATSRASEFIFRLDEDEFLIFFADINEYSNIKVIRSRLESYFLNPLNFDGKQIMIKLDFGYSVYPEDGDSFEKVFNVAKQRLYVNKRR